MHFIIRKINYNFASELFAYILKTNTSIVVIKKYGFLSIFLFGLLVSCSNSDLPDVDGMWQLKTIGDSAGRIQTVDTIYYSFQAQRLFAFTQLNGGPWQSQPAFVMYGYVDFPAKDRMLIRLDPAHGGLFTHMPWSLERTTYFIRKLTSKEMILENEEEGDTYQFIKF